MPCLYGLEADDGSVHGAVGFRCAGDQVLFLERYLDVPIEQAIRLHCGRVVSREELVEVGNLAAEGPGTARQLIVELTGLLAACRYRWVAFTATRMLANSFLRLGLVPCSIGCADGARMGDERAEWGRYYDGRPRLMVGEIRVGHRQLSGRDSCDSFNPAARRAESGPVDGLHVA